MVRRTARRGSNQGQEFCGCPTFPKCRGTVFDASPDDAPITIVHPSGQPAEVSDDGASRETPRGWLHKIAKTVDQIDRWRLDSYEPDASGRWNPEQRERIQSYVYERDGRRCGVCGGETRIDGAHVEHIVPKIFAFFDLGDDGKAVQGTRYRSLLHKLDNLQAAHTYCNKNKGNKPDVSRWRHPTMPTLTVAVAEDGTEFRVPSEPSKNPRLGR